MKKSISWNEYFMNIAYLSSFRSKDPNTKVGACIVNNNNRIVGVGYNGAPNSILDEEIPWDNVSDPIHNKYNYVIHAEINAILNSNSANLSGYKLFTTHFPCNACAKLIVQKGIVEVFYYFDTHLDEDICAVSKLLFKKANIKTTNLYSKINIIYFNNDAKSP